MATLISDETDASTGGGIVIGAVEFLPPDAKTPTVLRSISRLAIEKHAHRTNAARSVMIGKIMSDPTPTVATVAPCERCLKIPRIVSSTLCADCGGKTYAARRASLLDREVAPRDFLMMCFLVGLLIFCALRFGAPNQSSEVEIHGRTTAAGSR